jgi:hypothetical protein
MERGYFSLAPLGSREMYDEVNMALLSLREKLKLKYTTQSHKLSCIVPVTQPPPVLATRVQDPGQCLPRRQDNVTIIREVNYEIP